VATGSTACGEAQTARPRRPAFDPTSISLCEPHREFIEVQLRLKRNVGGAANVLDYLGGSSCTQAHTQFVAVKDSNRQVQNQTPAQAEAEALQDWSIE
jgi:hypothetical protein